ncbi:MAG: MFS transporter [Bradyrhizobium sp.]|uniref:MFS transporter n=1 Tax=Bradyrhizobium sp. TaxID=376 RepID=UPI003D09C1F0
MENRPAAAPRFASTALMLGNVVTGCAVLAPAGMLKELSEGLDVSIRTAGLLITFGAIVLCVGSPVTAWLTSRIERRVLLSATLAVLAATNIASAFAPDYASLLGLRLLMLAVGVIYTPQAAGTAAMIVPETRRGSTIAYVFLGWSLAAAIGLPLIALVSHRYGWRVAYGGVGALGLISFLLLTWRLPRGLFGAPVALRTWLDLARNRLVVLLLLVTTLYMAGQFVIFTFMGPLVARLTGASADAASLMFALYGVFGFLGVAVATRIVDGWGAYRTSLLSVSLVLAGVAGWAFSAGNYVLMAVSVAIWGLGFASSNSMQQVRLVAAAPSMASASVSLNTSVLYVGQAIGSAVGGVLYGGDFLYGMGYAATTFLALALVTVVLTRTHEPG